MGARTGAGAQGVWGDEIVMRSTTKTRAVANKESREHVLEVGVDTRFGFCQPRNVGSTVRKSEKQLSACCCLLYGYVSAVELSTSAG